MSGGIPPYESMSARRRKDAPPGRVVSAQVCKDSSYIESVTNFFHGIGQVYGGTSQVEEKETVIWARFLDFESVLYPELSDELTEELHRSVDSTLLLLGYKNGIQAWIFEENGSLREILSLRQGPVKTACLIPSKKVPDTADRPLLAVCMAADRKQLFTCVRLVSLRTGEDVEQLDFDHDVEDLRMGCSGLLIVTFLHEIRVFDVTGFSCLFTISDCYQGAGNGVNPIAVSTEWLAYCPAKTVSSRQSAGGVNTDVNNSYTATVISAAKTLRKGFGEAVNWLAKPTIPGTDEPLSVSPRDLIRHKRNSSAGSLPELEMTPGFVTVLDVQTLCNLWKADPSSKSAKEHVVNGVAPSKAVTAHFHAHDEAVVCMEFSPCGSLLATADEQGHAFHVFSILPHPVNPKMSAAVHLYTLNRGETSAKVLQFSYSHDCRWLSASTHRGTTHVFPISTYGGPATIRTHVSHRVVNRTSLFKKSAGLEDLDPRLKTARYGRPQMYGPRMNYARNPRLLPHPLPTVTDPLAQIGASWAPDIPKMADHINHSMKLEKSSTAKWQGDGVAAAFLKGQLRSSSSPGHDDVSKRSPIPTSSKGGQCLVIFTTARQLIEYHFQPKPLTGLKNISEDSPVEIVYRPTFQWSVQRSVSWDDVNLPLPPASTLLQVDDSRRKRIQRTRNVTSAGSVQPALCHATQNNRDTSEVGKAVEDPTNQQPQPRVTKSARSLRSGQYPGTARSMTPSESPVPSSKSDHGLQQADFTEELETGRRPSESDNFDVGPRSSDSDEWLSQVEMTAHEGPARRIWMQPQFRFMVRHSTGSTTLLSSSSSAMFSNRSRSLAAGQNPTDSEATRSLDDDLDLDSLKIRQNQSDPVPTPKGSSDRYEPGTITIEDGSGNFERNSYMREHAAHFGSWEDRTLNRDLIEQIAEAMQDTEVAVTKQRTIRSDESSDTLGDPCPELLLTAGQFEFDDTEMAT